MNERAHLPNHIGIILDATGAGRAARAASDQGPRARPRAVQLAVRSCRERGIPFLTLYAFSVANWSRPKDEVDALMRICAQFAEENREELVERGVAVQIIGDPDEMPTRTRRAMERLVAETKGGQAMTLALALSYGGRRDMVNAVRALAISGADRPGDPRGDHRGIAPELPDDERNP